MNKIDFLHPELLWALILILIPIILHLFNFRRYKTVYFSNVSFLRNLQQESRKTRNVKSILILLLRCFFIAALVICFAQPFFSDNKKEATSTFAIYIDNSFSMDVNHEGINKLEQSKNLVESIIQKAPNNTKFVITTNAFDKNSLVAHNKDKAATLLAEIVPSPISKNIHEVLKRQFSFLSGAGIANSSEIILISDFQNLADSNLRNIDSIPVNLIPMRASENQNISIDSVWFENPIRKSNGKEVVKFKITNTCNRSFQDFPVSLLINGKPQKQTISLNENSTTIGNFTFNIPNSALVSGAITIDESFFQYDNVYHFAYPLKKELNVTIIYHDKNIAKPIANVFKGDSNVTCTLKEYKNVDFSEVEKSDLLILVEPQTISQVLRKTIQKLTKQQKTVALFPNPEQPLLVNTFNEVTAARDTSTVAIQSVAKKSNFFDGVFEKEQLTSENLKESFPTLFKHVKLTTSSQWQNLITKEDGSPYLIKNKNQFIFATGLSKTYSNITTKALFVPVLYQLLNNSNQSKKIAFSVGELIEILPNQQLSLISPKTLKLKLPQNQRTVIVPKYQEIGVSKLVTEKEQIVSAFGINLAQEERLNLDENFKNYVALTKALGVKTTLDTPTADEISLSFSKQTYWFHFLVLALACLIAEMIVIAVKK